MAHETEWRSGAFWIFWRRRNVGIIPVPCTAYSYSYHGWSLFIPV